MTSLLTIKQAFVAPECHFDSVPNLLRGEYTAVYAKSRLCLLQQCAGSPASTPLQSAPPYGSADAAKTTNQVSTQLNVSPCNRRWHHISHICALNMRRTFDLDLPGTLAFDHPTAAALAAFILARLSACELQRGKQLPTAALLRLAEREKQRYGLLHVRLAF